MRLDVDGFVGGYGARKPRRGGVVMETGEGWGAAEGPASCEGAYAKSG